MSMDFEACLNVLSQHRTDEFVVASMSPNSLWPFVSKSDRDLSYTDPMGSVAPVSLGIALARPDVRIWAMDGDGGLLMYLGGLVTIANMAPPNLIHFLFDNEAYGLVGLPTPGVGKRDFPTIARGAGIEEVHSFDMLEDLDQAMPQLVKTQGPTFVALKVKDGPTSTPEGMEKSRLRRAAPEGKLRYGRQGVKTLRRILSGLDAR